ncbi:MAG: energy-coupled thiamine transporter ThiT [Coriobacteriia bacterium]|nr:energy-coupled thiamine transporter ThiT [Coriobacteriia bacterium]
MRDIRIRIIAEVGLALALFAVLELLPVFKLPYGGSISLSMLPIVLVALMRGPAVGIICGALAGFIDAAMLPNTYIISPVQAALDYPIAYGLVGLAGFFKPGLFKKSSTAKPSSKKTTILCVVLGTLLGGASRFAAHFTSGLVFFGMYAPEFQHPALYSLIYNISYMGPSAVVTAVLAALVYPLLAKALNLDTAAE